MEMAESPLKSIREHFSSIKNPRIERKKLHPLLNIILFAICDVNQWGRELGG
jgi:hypothetical protein